MITPLDKTIAKGILVIVPLFVFGAYAMTESQYPHNIPLQAALDEVEPLPPVVNTSLVQVKPIRTEYHISARSMAMVAQIHNLSDQPVQVGEFATANLRFLNPAVGVSDKNQDDAMVAAQGLSLDDPRPIPPGETRSVRITAADALWETQKLEGLFRDADSRMGGLLFLYDASGKRHIASISTAVIPKFD